MVVQILSSPSTWITITAIIITLGLKRFLILPWLHRKLKINFVERQKLRQRRLQETLKDPVLSSDLEDKLKKRHNKKQSADNNESDDGAKEQALQTMMDQLRMKSEEDISSSSSSGDSSSPRGEERREASSIMLLGTFVVAIFTSCVHNIVSVGFFSPTYTPKIHLLFDSATVHLIVFFLIHIGDSWLLYQKEHKYIKSGHSNQTSSRKTGYV